MTCCSIRTKLTLGNGCYTEYTYDDAKRLTSITNKKSNGTVISAWEYGYDDVGNVTSQTDKDSLVTSYTYDDIYQLTHVNYPSGSDFGYEYDGVGNRTKMHEYTSSTITTSYTYDNADELTGYSGGGQTVTFGYAADGCLTSKSDGTDTYAYVWDQERRLAAFKKNGHPLVQYGYNPTGTRRFASDSTLGLENYFYHGAHALADYTPDWAMKRSYILGPSIDEILCMLDQGQDQDTVTAYYFMKDRISSTRELVNASETINTRYDYDVWSVTTEAKLLGDVSTRYGVRSLERLSSGSYESRGLQYAPSEGRNIQPGGLSLLSWEPPRYGHAAAVTSTFADDRRCCSDPPTPACSTGTGNSLIGWCEEWRNNCRSACESSCGRNNWRRAVCYRCCQCYFKRCWMSCPTNNRGQPPKCKFPLASGTCVAVCPGQVFDGFTQNTQGCDDQGGANTWKTICGYKKSGDDIFTWDEYGVTVGLLSTPRISRPGGGWCQGCNYDAAHIQYPNGSWYFPRISIVPVVAPGVTNDCPKKFPLFLTTYYHDPGAPNDFTMWITCP